MQGRTRRLMNQVPRETCCLRIETIRGTSGAPFLPSHPGGRLFLPERLLPRTKACWFRPRQFPFSQSSGPGKPCSRNAHFPKTAWSRMRGKAKGRRGHQLSHQHGRCSFCSFPPAKTQAERKPGKAGLCRLHFGGWFGFSVQQTDEDRESYAPRQIKRCCHVKGLPEAHPYVTPSPGFRAPQGWVTSRRGR